MKYDFLKLRDLLKREIIGYETDEYVNKVSSLTHLVFTKTSHEKVILSSTDSFQFICPVHFERTPSCRVFNGRRELFCYGCHKEHKPIDFLERVEYIDETEALNLLATIYLIDIEPTPEIGIDNIHLIEKYRNTLTSDEFKLLLERAYERTKKKRQTAAVRSALDTFEEDFAMIERVKKGKHDIFVPKNEKPKTLILETPYKH